MRNNFNPSKGRFVKQLPIAKNEDVEFQEELADEDDLEAAQRAAEADNRQQTEMANSSGISEHMPDRG